MSYTRQDIPALIGEFRKAKQNISTSEGCNYFLCNALKRSKPSQYVVQALELVRESLDGHFTLQDWLNLNGRCRYLGDDAHRRLRVKWCDKIIADLQDYAK